jgi:hypothetical protein
MTEQPEEIEGTEEEDQEVTQGGMHNNFVLTVENLLSLHEKIKRTVSYDSDRIIFDDDTSINDVLLLSYIGIAELDILNDMKAKVIDRARLNIKKEIDAIRDMLEKAV